MDEMLDAHFASEARVHEAFGYVEDWKRIPLEDFRRFFWHLSGGGHGDVVGYADSEAELTSQSGNYYEAAVYTQRFLPRWVYRADTHTLVCMDPGTDGNKYLGVFDNRKEWPRG